MRRLLAATLGSVLVAGLLVGTTLAAKAVAPSCSFDPSVVPEGQGSLLTAINLPVGAEIRLSFNDLYPYGGWVEDDGTFQYPNAGPAPMTAYFWRRGHGKSLIKPGQQLNDYHVIAYCVLESS